MSSSRYDHYSFNIIKTQSVEPLELNCPQCGQTGKTLVDLEHSRYTYAACTGIAALGGVLGCCVAPFYMDRFKNADHFCSTCGNELAKKVAFDKTTSESLENRRGR